MTTSRQKLWPNVSHELLLKRGAQKHPSPPPRCHSPPRPGRGWLLAGAAVHAVQAAQGTVRLVARLRNNGVAMPRSSVP